MSKGSIPESEYLLATEDAKVFHSLLQLEQASPGLAFDVLLTANGLDHALLGAPGEHGRGLKAPATQRIGPEG